MTRLLTILVAALFAALSQLMLPSVADANSNVFGNSKSIIGFVFQDHDANGTFDDGDNTFASAAVYLQKIGTTEIEKIMVDNSGYFEISALSDGIYSIWASHYGIMSDSHVVEVASNGESVVVTLSIATLTPPAMEISSIQERTADTDNLSIMLPFIVG